MGQAVRHALFAACILHCAFAATWASEATQNGCPPSTQFLDLTLKDALLLAHDASSGIAIARQDLEKAKANVLSATTPFLPAARFSLHGEHYTHQSDDANCFGSTVIGGQGDRNSNCASLRVNWNLYSGGKDVAQSQATEAGLRASTAALRQKFNDTFDALLTAYVNLMKEQLAYQNHLKSLQVTGQLAEQAERRFARGMGALLQVEQARMAVSQAMRETTQSCQALFQKSGTLAQILNRRLRPGAVFLLTDQIPPPPQGSLTIEYEARIQADPGVLAARERLTEAQRKLDSTRAAYYPTMELVGRYDWFGQNQNNYSTAVNEARQSGYRVGIQLQQALFPFSTVDGAVQSAQAEVAKSSVTYQQTVVDVETRMRNALNDKLMADHSLSSARRSAGSARELARLTKEMFVRGHANQDTVDRATLSVEKEQRTADELGLDADLKSWLAFRAVYPEEFQAALLRASGVEQTLGLAGD
jgi:outer membrane protein TolC